MMTFELRLCGLKLSGKSQFARACKLGFAGKACGKGSRPFALDLYVA